MIKNIQKIIKNDISATLKNPVVLIVLFALIILPSLYSVINVYACWDPYEDTDNIDYIIVNNDNPVTVNGTTYAYGDMVVEKLQNNSNFNWVYKDEDEARGLVKNGTQYAAIIIPEDFSQDIMSVYSGNPKQASIEYVDNHKTSPVAPKITSKAASNVVTEINDYINEQYNSKNYISSNPVLLQESQASQTQNATNTTNATTTNTTAQTAQTSSVQNVQNYFHSPTTLSNDTYYEADTYGQQVTPFYTVLAAWVGCIILVALLSAKPTDNKEKYRPIEIYFGKIGLFFIMSILQSIVTFLALCLLGIPMDNGALMLGCMILIGLSFMTLIYSLVSVFGNVGKALALIILVFQISGTNGIYPIEIMSGIFQTLMPYLPMTYGILMLKDAVFGVIWPSFTKNVICLIIFPLCAIALSIIIKEKLDKSSRYFEEKLDESKLFELRK